MGFSIKPLQSILDTMSKQGFCDSSSRAGRHGVRTLRRVRQQDRIFLQADT